MIYWLIKSAIFKNKKPSNTLYDTIRFHHRVKWTYIDTYWHINNAKYLQIYEKARWDFGFKTGLTKICMEKKYLYLVMSAEITYIRELKLGQKFDVITKLIATDDKYFYFEQQMKRGDVLHNHALFKVLIAGKKKVKPQDLHDMVYDKPFNPLNHPVIEEWKKMGDLKKSLV